MAIINKAVKKYLIKQRLENSNGDTVLQPLYPATIASQIIQENAGRLLGQTNFILGSTFSLGWNAGVTLTTSETAPSTPNIGNQYFNETSNTLFTYTEDGEWSGVVIPTAQPSDPTFGTRWFNETENKLFTYVNTLASGTTGNWTTTVQQAAQAGNIVLTLPAVTGTLATEDYVLNNIPTLTTSSNLLYSEYDDGEIKFEPFASATADLTWVGDNANAGKLYLGTVNPSKATRLNYNGNFYANKLFSGGNEVLTAIANNSLTTGQAITDISITNNEIVVTRDVFLHVGTDVSSVAQTIYGVKTFANDLIVGGDLIINGTTTTLNTRELTVDDKNIDLGSVVTKTGLVATLAIGTNVVTLTTGNTSGVIPGQILTKTAGAGVFGTGARVGVVSSATSFTVVNAAGTDSNHATLGSITFSIEGASDASANGGGITLRGTTNKTIIWDSTNSNWTSSEHWNIANGKAFKINNAEVLSATTLGSTVVSSSLTSVGTIGTGTWQGTVVSPTYGGTGVNNGTKTITLGGNLTTSGAHTTTLTTTANTSLILPTTGTLATLAGSEALTNKTVNGLTLTAASAGFTIAGGTSSKTLTINESSTIGALTSGHVLYASDTNTIGSEAQLAISRGGTGAATANINVVFAGPSTGSAAAPSFRSLVNADLPNSGVTASTYSTVAVNAKGIVTGGGQLIEIGGATPNSTYGLVVGGLFFEEISA